MYLCKASLPSSAEAKPCTRWRRHKNPEGLSDEKLFCVICCSLCVLSSHHPGRRSTPFWSQREGQHKSSCCLFSALHPSCVVRASCFVSREGSVWVMKKPGTCWTISQRRAYALIAFLLGWLSKSSGRVRSHPTDYV